MNKEEIRKEIKRLQRVLIDMEIAELKERVKLLMDSRKK